MQRMCRPDRDVVTNSAPSRKCVPVVATIAAIASVERQVPAKHDPFANKRRDGKKQTFFVWA
jgi:hypothetical protein